METNTTLKRLDLANHLMDRLNVPRHEADILVETFLRCIVESLHRGEGIELRGFGSFRLRDRKPRAGRNPKNGETVHIPAKRVVYFKTGLELRARLVDENP